MSVSHTQLPEWLGDARAHGFLGRLPDTFVAAVVARGQRVEYQAGGVGLRWEEQPMAAIVLKGAARSFLAYPDGSQVTTRYLGPGDMVGVFAARQPRLARGIQALERCELLMVAGSSMRDLSLAHPAVAWALVEELTTILNVTHRALYLRAFGSVRQRVAVAIMDRARLAGEVTRGQIVRGTQSELATGAGTVREVVATALQGLKRQGVIDIRRGSVVILDPERLALEADAGLESRDGDVHLPGARAVPLA